MTSALLRRAPLVLLAFLCSCDTTLKRMGEPCGANGQCSSGLCHDGRCSLPCARQGDCPVGFDCGLRKPADATTTGGLGATCYASPADQAQGGFGASCALLAPDPKTGTACDPNATNPCATGFSCHAARKCDPAAYCTKGCTTDTDCPPTMFCGTDSAGFCLKDEDCGPGFTCAAIDGGAKICRSSTAHCLKREGCSDCALDDQCPIQHVCATDKVGGRFCGRICKDVNDCNGPIGKGELFMECVQSGANKVCVPTVGACHGPSPLASQVGKTDTFCSPCRTGVPGDCGSNFCFRDEFTNERFCTQPCTVTLTWNGSARVFDLSNDTCPSGMACYAGIPRGCTRAPCDDVPGICTADTTNTDPEYYTSTLGLTCYPIQ